MGNSGEQSEGQKQWAADKRWAYVIFAILFALIMISLSNLASARADELGSNEALADPAIQSCMACLWKHTGNDLVKTEAAAWLLKEPKGYRCYYWPQRAPKPGEPLPEHTVAAIKWQGVIPLTRIALIHTHPAPADRRPSPTDENVATHLGIPNYVVSVNGVWGAIPYQEIDKKGKIKEKIAIQNSYSKDDLKNWMTTVTPDNCPDVMPAEMLWSPWSTADNR